MASGTAISENGMAVLFWVEPGSLQRPKPETAANGATREIQLDGVITELGSRGAEPLMLLAQMP